MIYRVKFYTAKERNAPKKLNIRIGKNLQNKHIAIWFKLKYLVVVSILKVNVMHF